jgi:hypothetical protein
VFFVSLKDPGNKIMIHWGEELAAFWKFLLGKIKYLRKG